ncbi:MAG: phosphodiester glycosidase family protein [Clostridiales bacterium]|nr:phosphodiester glycosidase family protein [Clostridiales bacterium]
MTLDFFYLRSVFVKRIVAVATASSIIFALFTACDSTEQSQNDYFIFTEATSLIYSNENSSISNEKTAKYISTELSKMSGKTCNIFDDSFQKNGPEILIGDTNRAESQRSFELTYYDYAYSVISTDCVVIQGGSSSAIRSAANKFLADCYGHDSDNNGAVKPIPVGTKYVYRHEYQLKSFSINGVDIKDYEIVCEDNNLSMKAAVALQTEIEKICSVSLRIKTIEQYKGSNAFCVGMTDVDGSSLADYGKSTYVVGARRDGASNTVYVDTSANLESIISIFCKDFLSDLPESRVFDLKIDSNPNYYCTNKNQFNGLTLTNEESTEIADGVEYILKNYTDKDGKRVIVYVMVLDMDKVDVINGTPDNGYVSIDVKANVQELIDSAVDAGYTVFGAVNADFFDINATYSPRGLCVKDGKVMSGTNDRPWFGITDQGELVIGDHDDYRSTYTGKLRDAVGGSHIILKNGMYNELAFGDEFGYTRHPRTAIGITKDGNIVLAVVDGRQPELSNGATLSDLADIMLELGAVDALNLDGGGSSTMITQTQNGYKTQNSPSDGELREVFNALVVTKK